MSETTIAALLQPIKEQIEGLSDLCPEHLRQGIRHLQRNCDIECNLHEDETSWDACKQPDRYSGDRMARALSDQAKLIAAIEEVEDWCKNLDAVERANPGVLNVRAEAVSAVLRKVIALALESAA